MVNPLGPSDHFLNFCSSFEPEELVTASTQEDPKRVHQPRSAGETEKEHYTFKKPSLYPRWSLPLIHQAVLGTVPRLKDDHLERNSLSMVTWLVWKVGPHGQAGTLSHLPCAFFGRLKRNGWEWDFWWCLHDTN